MALLSKSTTQKADESLKECEALIKYSKNLVVISNSLVKSSYSLTLIELRILVQFMSLIDSRNSVETYTGKYFYIPIEEYADIFGVSYKTARELVEEATRTLMTRTFRKRLSDNTGEIEYHWVENVRYMDNGVIELMWKDELLYEISDLAGKFASFRLRFLLPYTSVYSLRWYMLLHSEAVRLRSFENIGIGQINKEKKEQGDKDLLSTNEVYTCTIGFSIAEIREMFDLQDKYKLTVDLKRYVIEGPLQELIKERKVVKDKPINLYDLKVLGISYVKQGRNIIRVDITVKLLYSLSGANMLISRVNNFKDAANMPRVG